MSDLTANINGLQSKLEKLIQLHQQSLRENEVLEEKIAVLKQQVQEKDHELNELSEKNKIVKLARALKGADEGKSTELKLKINELVREVDKCLALLNR